MHDRKGAFMRPFFSFSFVTSRLVDKTAVCQTNKPTMNVDR